jgi:putative oxidoreductase
MYRFAGGAHSLLRIFAAASYMTHGMMKLFGWFGGMPPGAPLTPLLMTAGIIETFGGTLLLVGLFARPVAFIASGEMAFAYFIAHNPRGFWPVLNHGEPVVLFCFIWLFMAAAGPGPVSLDRLFQRRRVANERDSHVA